MIQSLRHHPSNQKTPVRMVVPPALTNPYLQVLWALMSPGSAETEAPRGRFGPEQAGWDGISECLVSGRVQVQVVAAVK
jgi:hypothetical protein